MSEMNKTTDILVDDQKEGVTLLLEQRLPWLIIGLLGAMGVSVIMSQFEEVLNRDISFAFFLPAIVYLSDAIGTQTETIFVRNMAREKIKMGVYLFKELMLGLNLGLIFGVLFSLFAGIWLHDWQVAWSVGLAMFVNALIAPLIALITPMLLKHANTDPALGAGPFTTIIQDVLSVLIYFSIATAIIFR